MVPCGEMYTDPFRVPSSAFRAGTQREERSSPTQAIWALRTVPREPDDRTRNPELGTRNSLPDTRVHPKLPRMTSLLDDLRARGFVHDATPGLAERLAQGSGDRLRGVRSHRGFAPRRQPGAGDGSGLAAAVRRHADRTGGRRHRHGRGSEREAGRAAHAVGGTDRQQCRPDTAPAGAVSRFRRAGERGPCSATTPNGSGRWG